MKTEDFEFRRKRCAKFSENDNYFHFSLKYDNISMEFAEKVVLPN